VWLFGVAESLIAVTLNPTIGLITFLLGFVAHFVITRQIQKQRSAQKAATEIFSGRHHSMPISHRKQKSHDVAVVTLA